MSGEKKVFSIDIIYQCNLKYFVFLNRYLIFSLSPHCQKAKYIHREFKKNIDKIQACAWINKLNYKLQYNIQHWACDLKDY